MNESDHIGNILFQATRTSNITRENTFVYSSLVYAKIKMYVKENGK